MMSNAIANSNDVEIGTSGDLSERSLIVSIVLCVECLRGVMCLWQEVDKTEWRSIYNLFNNRGNNNKCHFNKI